VLTAVTSLEDNMKPDANMIAGAMAAEAALAKQEADSYDETIESLPEDHPLRMVADEQKKLLGDLGNLPPGHPVLLAMEEARLRFEAEKAAEAEADTEAEEAEGRQLKRAKKLDAKKAAREARDREEEKSERLRVAAKSLNSSMTEAIDSLKRLNDNITASQEDFAGDRYALMKMGRLSRVVVAAMHGIAQSKLSPGRVSNG
jgi:hypothetical protein